MTEQRTPEEFVTENELICEKLLGWRKRTAGFATPGIEFYGWRLPNGLEQPTPSFTTWAEAGLILEALSAAGLKTVVGDKSVSGSWWCTADAICQLRNTGPLAIRAAALAYIQAVKS